MENFEYHHVGLAVKDMQSAAKNLADLFGYTMTSGPVAPTIPPLN
jgi:hypothetical protein